MSRVTVVIPTAAWPGRYLAHIVDALSTQRQRQHDILILDSSDKPGRVATILKHSARTNQRISVVEVKASDFRHGTTRNLALTHSRSPFIAFLSDDAVPVDDRWLSELVEACSEQGVVGAFSRQIPRHDDPLEKFFYDRWFPPIPKIRRRSNPPALRDCFFSNASSCIRRDALERFRFDDAILMSEDQDFARRALDAGFATSYAPTSRVLHSHRFGPVEAFRRYFDSAHTLKHLVPDPASQYLKEGTTFVLDELKHIAKHHPKYLPRLIVLDAAKALGTLLGAHADKLPRSLARFLSAHPRQWPKD